MIGAFKTIRRNERRETLIAFSVLFMVLASHTVLETARDALFLGTVRPEQLPLVYIGLALVALAAAGLHARVSETRGKVALAVTLVASGAITLLFWRAVGSTGNWLLYVLYVWPGLVAALVILQFWTLLGAALTITQAKRIYGAIGVGSVAGAIAGAALASWMSSYVSVRHLLVPAAAGLTIAGGLSLFLGSSHPVGPIDLEASSRSPPARDAFASPYARGIILVAVLGAAVATVGDYLFKSTVAQRVDAADLGGFLARVYLGFNGVSLLCQVLLANLAIRRLGVPLAAAALPVIAVGTALGAFVLPLLPAALLVRGADASLRHSVHRTAFELLSVPLHPRTRGVVKRLVEVLGTRGGQAIASLVILALVALPEPRYAIIAALGLVSALWLVATVRLRKNYIELFRRRMDDRQLVHLREFPELDAASLETVVSALDSDDDIEVIAAIEALERDDKAHLVPRMLLFHPSPKVVRRVLVSFVRGGRKETVPAIDRLLSRDASGPLRASALAVRASLALDHAMLTGDGEVAEAEEVRAAAAVCRVAYLSASRAPVEALTSSPSVTTRIAIIEAIAATRCLELGDLLESLAHDTAQEVRDAAIVAMGQLAGDEMTKALVQLMGSDATRAQARQELRALGDSALEVLAQALADVARGPLRRDLGEVIAEAPDPERAASILLKQLAIEPDGLVRYRLIRSLESIVAHHPQIELDQRVIRAAITATLGKAYRYFAYEIGLEANAGGESCPSPGCRLLRRLLRDKRQHAVGRLFRLLGLAIPSESFAAAYRGITSDRPDLRANAIELVDNVLPAELRLPVLGLVDDLTRAERFERGVAHRLAERMDHLDVLKTLQSGPASSLREAAEYHARELGMLGPEEALHAQ